MSIRTSTSIRFIKNHTAVNAILYLNKGWTERDGGGLELWDMENKQRFANVVPIFNRCAIFETSEISYHGNPMRVTRDGPGRLSYSLYYYTDTRPDKSAITEHSTVYVDRPGEYTNSMRKLTAPIKKVIPKTLSKIRDVLID